MIQERRVFQVTIAYLLRSSQYLRVLVLWFRGGCLAALPGCLRAFVDACLLQDVASVSGGIAYGKASLYCDVLLFHSVSMSSLTLAICLR